jgi:hypothetical protein
MFKNSAFLEMNDLGLIWPQNPPKRPVSEPNLRRRTGVSRIDRDPADGMLAI